MAKLKQKTEVNQSEKVSQARLLIELYLDGKLSLWDLTKRLERLGMKHTKIEKSGKLIFVIRGKDIKDTRLEF